MKPPVDMTGADNVWAIAVRVFDALEARDGNRKQANTFHCEFMRCKDGPPEDLVALVEKYVEVVG